MTIRLLLLSLALLLVVVLPAQAIDTSHWPITLVDDTCTDTEDTPSPGTGSVQPAIQTSGSGDGFCDHDSRIVTGAITSDTKFTIQSKSRPCVYVFASGTTVTGGDTKWRLNQAIKNPVTDFITDADIGTLVTGAVTNLVLFGRPTGYSATSGVDEFMNLPLTRTFILELDIQTATSWTGSIFLVWCE